MNRDLIARYQAPIIEAFALGLGGLYLLRAGIVSFFQSSDDVLAPTLLFSLLSLTLISGGYLSTRLPAHRLLNFVLVSVVMLVEAWLAYSGHLSFVHFYILIPLFIIFCSLFSGLKLGSLIALSAVAISIALVKIPKNPERLFDEKGPYFAASFLAYLSFAQIFVILLVYCFSGFLDKSKKELQRRRFIRVRSTRRVTMADAIGKAAHELNNPIAILDGALHLLSNRPKDPAARKLMISAMSNAENRLGRVIESIQKFADGGNQEEIKAIKVLELIEDFRIQSEPILSRFGTQIEIINQAPSQLVNCRSNQIHFILSVLLENALEASDTGQIFLRLTIKPADKKIRFELEDHGHSISEDLADTIFIPFHTTKDVGQTLGMNLSLCRVSIEEQGGSIGFSRLAEGTLFWFELPDHPA